MPRAGPGRDEGPLDGPFAWPETAGARPGPFRAPIGFLQRKWESELRAIFPRGSEILDEKVLTWAEF